MSEIAGVRSSSLLVERLSCGQRRGRSRRCSIAAQLLSEWIAAMPMPKPGDDLREVLEVAHQGAAPGLEVELVRHDQGVARLHHLRFDAAAAEEAALVDRAVDGAVGAQDEHVVGVGGFVGAGQAQVVARRCGPASRRRRCC